MIEYYQNQLHAPKFGTRRSEVQILSPRPILKDLSELIVGAIGRNSGRVKPNPTLCAVIVRKTWRISGRSLLAKRLLVHHRGAVCSFGKRTSQARLIGVAQQRRLLDCNQLILRATQILRLFESFSLL